MRTFLLIIYAMIFISEGFFSQNKMIEFYEYSIENGLVDNWINDFEKDQNGFIWIATNNGISRFDGYNFINFSAKNYPIIPENSGFQDIQIHDNLIYAISEFRGVFTINTTNFEVQQVEKNGVRSYARSKNKVLTYFTDGKLTLRESGKIRSLRNFGSVTKNGKVILVGNYIYFNKSFSSFFKLDLDLNIISRYELNNKANGIFLQNHPKLGILIGTSKGVFAEKENKFIPLGEHSLENKYSFYGITNEGKHYYVLNFKEPIFPKEKKTYSFNFEKDQNKEVRTIYHLGGDYWLIGTNQGLYKLNLTPRFNTYIKDDLIKDDQIRVRRKIISDKSDLFLFGFPEIIKYNFDSNTLKSLSAENLSNYDAVKIDQKIISTSEGAGVWKLDLQSNKLEKILTQHIHENIYFICVYKLNESTLLFGGKGVIVYYDLKQNTSKLFNIVGNYDIQDIYKDPFIPDGFILATDKGIFTVKLNFGKIDNIEVKPLQKTINNINVRDIHFSNAKKQFWLATDEGILVLDNTLGKIIKRYRSKEEITNTKVTGIIEDKRGRIWASTFSGITCIDISKNKTYLIRAKNGLINLEFNYKSFEILPDGRIVFGGLFGYDIINPNNFNFKTPNTKIILSGYKIDNPLQKINTYLEVKKDLRFQTGKEDLLMFFSTSDFKNSELYSFEYSINKGDWLDLENNKVLRISNLTGGEHQIEIRLKDQFGNICDQQKFRVIAEIPFFQKTSFYILISLLVITLSFLAIYYFNRMRKVEVETKKRIAMDLHDETGTILTRVLLLSKNETFLLKNIHLFQANLKEALFSLRTFMDSLSGKGNKLSDLLIETREIITNNLKGTGIKGNLILDKTVDFYLSNELYRDIKLCLYEALNNSIKHSNATELTIEYSIENHMLKILIMDNGSINKPLSDLEKHGNGLRNFQKRTKRHNGLFTYDTETKNNSLLLQFQFPINY